MDRAGLEQALEQTLEDRRLSRAERRALREVLESVSLDVDGRNRLRAHAFDLVERSLGTEADRQALRWLRDTVGLLLHASEPEAPPEAAAAFSPGEDCRRMILNEIGACRQQLEVCVFTITDDRITAAVADAHQRGVKVRVVSDDDKSEDRGSDVAELQRLGIPVAYDLTEDHMHHKFALFDRRRLLTGSYNWTRSAFKANHENTVCTDDPGLVQAFRGEFERLWQQYAR